jgi:hypothetical protein
MLKTPTLLALLVLAWAPHCYGGDQHDHGGNGHGGDGQNHGEDNNHGGNGHGDDHHGGGHHGDHVTFFCTRQLSFGEIAANNGGTVVVAPMAFPPRVSTGSVTLPASSMSTSAKCHAIALPPFPVRTVMYSVSFPGDGVVKLSGPAGANMAVNKILGAANGPGQNPMQSSFLSTFSGTFYVGATLHVGPNQPSGNYSGTINASIDWP